MNKVTFPAFNIEFNINPVAFTIGSLDIYWYSICIVTGIISALILCFLNKNKFGIKFDDVLECSIYSVFFGIIGARLYYVLFNISSFYSIMDVINLRSGGLAIYGGLITGLIVIYLYCKIKKIELLDFLDYIIPAIPLAQSIGRFGNFFNMEAYGYASHGFLRMGINTINGYMEVHPTFLYESLCTLMIAIALVYFQKSRKNKGDIVIYYCMFYSFIRFFIEGLRQDSLMLFNFRISQVLSLIIFVCMNILVSCRKMTHESSSKNS